MGLCSWVATRLRRRAELSQARHDARLARLRAEVRLAPYIVKSDIEWDMRWADRTTRSWADELIVILWAAPTVGLFVPGISPYIVEGLSHLKALDPDAPSLFVMGWAIIFAAIFGLKQATNFMLPGRYAALVEAMGRAPDDVPSAALSDQPAHGYFQDQAGPLQETKELR